MPNVTFYLPTGQMPPDERLAELSSACVELCTRILGAARENVHVIHVAVRHGYGHPFFAEIQYRLESFRTPPLMNQFMQALDEAIAHHTGFTARIPCFGYAASDIHARN